MNSLDKAATVLGFMIGTTATAAITGFAIRTALTYGSKTINNVKHIATTTGKVWEPSQYHTPAVIKK